MNRRFSQSWFQQLSKTNSATNGTLHQVVVWHFWEIIWFQGFLKSWLRDFETLLNSCLVWFEQQSSSGGVWCSVLEQHTSGARRSKYKAGTGTLLWDCSRDVQHKWKQLWTLRSLLSVEWCIRPNESFQPFSLATKGKLKQVLLQYLLLYSTMHSCPIINAFTVIITTRSQTAWTNHHWRGTSAYQHPSRRDPNLLIYVQVSHQRMGRNFNQPERHLLFFLQANWSNTAMSVLVFLKA